MMTDLYTDAPSLSLASYRHKPKMKHCEYYTGVMEPLLIEMWYRYLYCVKTALMQSRVTK